MRKIKMCIESIDQIVIDRNNVQSRLAKEEFRAFLCRQKEISEATGELAIHRSMTQLLESLFG